MEAYAQWRKDHPGKEFHDIWGKWRKENPPFFHTLSQWDQEEIVIAALVQEGVMAWHGDATSLISQIISAQSRTRINNA